MRYKDLFETPIGDFNLMGDMKNSSSFSDTDLTILNRNKFLTKIKSSFSKTPFTFDVYILNTDKMNIYSTDRDVKHDALKKYFDSQGVYTPKEIEEKFGLNITPKDSNITILMLSNYTGPIGGGGHPLTPWIFAHRIIHSIEYQDYKLSGLDDIVDLIKANYDNGEHWSGIMSNVDKFEEYLYKILTMKSARNRDSRIKSEYKAEILTQYIITGKVTLNKIDNTIEELEQKLNETCHNILSKYIGKILVS